MKAFTILLLSLASISGAFASSHYSRSSSHNDRYEICYVDDKAIMMQANMCYAKGGKRTPY